MTRYAHVPYLIKAGDTLSALALRFLGRADRYTDLAKLNDLEDPGMIMAGETLMIPVAITPELMHSPVVVEALKPHQHPYPPTTEQAKAIYVNVSSTYSPTWDRDVDIIAQARNEGVVALALALGILDDAEAEHDLDAIEKAFAG
jgi:hypothetical protein